MTDKGLEAVLNPSDLFISEKMNRRSRCGA